MNRMAGRVRFTGHALPSPPRSPWRRPPSPRNARNMPQHIQMPLSSSSPSKSWDEGDEPPCSVRISPRPVEQPFVVNVWPEDIDEPPSKNKQSTLSTPSTVGEMSWCEDAKAASPSSIKSDSSWDAASHNVTEHGNSLLLLKRALAETTEQRDRAIAQQERLMELKSFDKTRIESLLKGKESLMATIHEQKHLGCSEAVQKTLEEKTQALESAKMIITSLESASGSQIAELRQKNRDKQAEIEGLEAELNEKQKTLDTLAIELRDNGIAAVPKQLIQRLEHNIADIRAEAVILEATQDVTSVSKLCDFLGDSIDALKEGLDCFSSASSSRTSERLSNERELQQKNARIRQLEDELHQLQEKLMNARSIGRYDGNEELQSLRNEVQSLRRQHTSNMAVLAKKEQELSVLRDSLKVDDNDVGYISDDAEDEEDTSHLSTPRQFTNKALCSPSHIEALATLLAHGGSMESHFSDYELTSSGEIDSVRAQLLILTTEKERALGELKTERESLANAKMIISSLENANKSMMQDLRSRLQESNIAIASLLHKSVGSEKTTAQLRSELDTLKREREQERERYQKELGRLRAETWTPPVFGRQDDKMITETID